MEKVHITYLFLFPLRWMQLRSADRRPGKGELRFTAEFHPTLLLPKTLQKRGRSRTADSSSSNITVQEERQEASQQQRREENDGKAVKDLHGAYVKYTPDDLVDLASYACGVLRIRIHEVQLPQFSYAYCQVIADSILPQYKTAKLKGQQLMFNEMADVFIKEADISRVAIEIKPAAVDEKEDYKLGYWIDTCKSIIRRIQNQKRRAGANRDAGGGGEWFSVFGAGDSARIRLSFDYIPMSSFMLNPDESIDSKY